MSFFVVGGGLSGFHAALFLRHQSNNDKIVLCDRQTISPSFRVELEKAKIEVLENFSDHSSLPNDTKTMVLSPGVSLESPLVVQAKANGITIRSEIDLALQNFRGQLIAITGTNGKSTITSMVGHILAKKLAKNAFFVGGNLGFPPTQYFRETNAHDLKIVALELSSYQLEQSQNLPDIEATIVSSFSEDHLARHKTMANYYKAKWQAIAHLRTGGLALVADSFEKWRRKLDLHLPKGADYIVVRHDDVPLQWLSDWPEHSRLNSWFAALACARVLGQDPESMQTDVSDFTNLAHRFEVLGTLKGTKYLCINDSKATNFEATATALASMRQPVTLLLGGLDKNEDPSSLDLSNVCELILFGAAANRLETKISNFSGNLSVHPRLESALAFVFNEDRVPSSAVLLAPGCASMDEFKSFEERGDYFCAKAKPFLD